MSPLTISYIRLATTCLRYNRLPGSLYHTICYKVNQLAASMSRTLIFAPVLNTLCAGDLANDAGLPLIKQLLFVIAYNLLKEWEVDLSLVS